jgi:hypothetical protein
LNGLAPVRKFFVPGYIIVSALSAVNILAVHRFSTPGNYFNPIKNFLHTPYLPAF